MYNNPHRFGSIVKPWTLAFLLASIFPSVSDAFEFSNESGSVTGSLDTTISFGASWRMQDRDPALIAISNGGTARDPNSDDGNLNYDKHDPISQIIKLTEELDLSYKNYGLFARGFAFYDYAVAHKDELLPEVQDDLESDVELRDAYVRAEFRPGGHPLNLRLGSQVVSWGESTFIPNGINIINPIDLNQFRTPGSELRDALIATTMVWGSQELSTNVTLEAVVLTNFDKIKIDPRGSFFSTNDFVSMGGNKAFTGFGRRSDEHDPPQIFLASATAQAWAPRSPDRNPKDSGQYGLAFRFFAPDLNNTDFGLYAVKYHSRIPFVSGFRGGLTVNGILDTTSLPNLVPGCTVIDPVVLAQTGNSPAACAAAAGRAGTYFVEYPENIRLYGLSFNTQGPSGIALQGEWSYRPNQPVQLPSAELLGAALGIANQITSTNPVTAFSVPYGTEISGFRRVPMNQIQFTGTKAFGPTWGADQLAMVGEVGYTRLDLPSDLKFAGPGVHLPQPGSNTTSSFGSTSTSGFATENSWGYRLLFRVDYFNAIGPATLSPRFGFSHDVNGVGPTFTEGVKAATLGLTYNLRQTWLADIAYTSYYGGKTYSGSDPNTSTAPPNSFPAGQSPSFASSSNALEDRDFLAVSISYAF